MIFKKLQRLINNFFHNNNIYLFIIVGSRIYSLGLALKGGVDWSKGGSCQSKKRLGKREQGRQRHLSLAQHDS